MMGKWQIIILSLMFFLVVDMGFLSNLDGMVLAFFMALLYFPSAPYLLFMVISVQDGAGLSYFWSYVSFVGLACLIIGHACIDRYRTRTEESGKKTLRIIAYFALIVIAWSLVVSLMNQYYGGLIQNADRRNPLLVALLMWLNIVVALIMMNQIKQYENIALAIALSVVNCLFVIVLQALIGPQLFHSAASVKVILDEPQLFETSALGFSRLTGTYLSPNAFAQVLFHFGLLLIALRPSFYKNQLAAPAFLLLAVIVFFFNQTKGATVLLIAAAILLFYFNRKHVSNFSKFISLMVAGSGTIMAAIYITANSNDILSSLRLVSFGESYRALALGVSVNYMTWTDWFFGMGLSHWLRFFDQYLPFTLSDPHNWIISIPGTFGFMGIILYIMVFVWLITVAVKTGDEKRFVAIMLLVKLAFHDLFEIPYLLGNVPLSFLIWITMGVLASGHMTQQKMVYKRKRDAF